MQEGKKGSHWSRRRHTNTAIKTAPQRLTKSRPPLTVTALTLSSSPSISKNQQTVFLCFIKWYHKRYPLFFFSFFFSFFFIKILIKKMGRVVIVCFSYFDITVVAFYLLLGKTLYFQFVINSLIIFWIVWNEDEI